MRRYEMMKRLELLEKSEEIKKLVDNIRTEIKESKLPIETKRSLEDSLKFVPRKFTEVIDKLGGEKEEVQK